MSEFGSPQLLLLFQVMPYSTGCKTALSNFEAGLDYRVSDSLSSWLTS
jgi:isoleucyl-tRNA synthetase